jgi:hypothetical protein
VAGEGGLLSKIETGNANRSDGTGQEGQNRKERIDRKVKKIQSSKEIEIAILHRIIKSEKDRRGQKGMYRRTG